MVGTGFVMTSTITAQNERIADTSVLADSVNLRHEQLAALPNIVTLRAADRAETVLKEAEATVATASGKIDPAELSASVELLTHYEMLAPQRVYALAEVTETHVAAVAAAVVEFDRLAAEKAAADAAAAAAAAAAASAAEEATSSPASSGGSRPSAPSNPSEAQSIARSLMASQYGWGDDQFGCLVSLWDRESGWNVNAYNSSSGATGIPQALPGSKMASAGADWQTNPATQISWGLGYISGRYGSPCGAWDKSQSSGWY